jgi:hypothetical protein
MARMSAATSRRLAIASALQWPRFKPCLLPLGPPSNRPPSCGTPAIRYYAVPARLSGGFGSGHHISVHGQFALHGIDPQVWCDPPQVARRPRLAAGMDVDVLHRHLLLAFAAVAVEGFQQRGEGAGCHNCPNACSSPAIQAFQ